MTRFSVRALYPGALALLIVWSTAVAASAPEAPRPETEASPATRTVERIAAVSVEGAHTIAVEIHRSKPRPDWWLLEMLREDDSVVVSIVDDGNPDTWIFSFDLDNDNEDLNGIAVQEGDSYRAYPLPQSTPEDFGLYRSRFLETQRIHKQDIGRYTILETIDAYALHANQLWFGKKLL